MKTYAIPEVNMEKLQKKVCHIQKKCKKYDVDFHFEIIDEYFEEVEKDNVVKFYVIEVEGIAKVDGWNFVGKIEKVGNDENIICSVVDVEIPKEYYTCELRCDHCNSSRHRNSTYIIQNTDTGEFKQVGSTCLQEYTHGLSAEVAAWLSTFIRDVEETYINYLGGTEKRYFALDYVLKYAYDYVKNLGYVSTSDESYRKSTRDNVTCAIAVDMGNANRYMQEEVDNYRIRNNFDVTSEDVVRYVDECIEYFKNLAEKEMISSYLHNLHIYAEVGYVAYKDMGYVVSMIPTYRFIVEKNKRDEDYRKRLDKEKNSKYVGEVHNSVEVKFADCKMISSWDNVYGGTTRRYKFVTEEGNVIMWDASKYIDLEERRIHDKTFNGIVVGTVKKLEEYNGVKQTWLTRCKVAFDD